jgi:diguanylate cyclase (GGDEF)-like protein
MPTPERDQISIDGVYVGAEGTAALQRELDRCDEGDLPFVLGFVDIAGLTAINFRSGDAAGDALLRAVAEGLRDRLGEDDPIVRIGADEFLFGISGTTLAGARIRAGRIGDAIREGVTRGSICIGLAQRGDGESLDTLRERAAADMTERKFG